MTNTSNNHIPVKGERTLSGEVVSTAMKDTIVVSVGRYRKHSKYGKYLTRSKNLKVHDPGNTCKVGEVVYIKETKPISKDKHFKVVGKKVSVASPVIEDTISEESEM